MLRPCTLIQEKQAGGEIEHQGHRTHRERLTSTVSKIVNGKDSSISEETRKKVLTIVKEYHYKPYASAAKRTRSYTIGVLLRSPSFPIARWMASSRLPRTPDMRPMPTTATLRSGT